MKEITIQTIPIQDHDTESTRLTQQCMYRKYGGTWGKTIVLATKPRQ